MDNKPVTVDSVDKNYFWRVLIKSGSIKFLPKNSNIIPEPIASLSPSYAILNSRI